MKDKIFIDTNIISYSYSKNELDKQTKANDLIFNNEGLNISIQVISELSNIFFRKFERCASQIENAVSEIDNIFCIYPIKLSTQIKALKIKENMFYNFMIV